MEFWQQMVFLVKDDNREIGQEKILRNLVKKLNVASAKQHLETKLDQLQKCLAKLKRNKISFLN